LEAVVFRTLGDSNRLVQFFLGLVQVPRRKMAKAKVILKDVGSKMCEFNLPYLPPKGHTLWILKEVKFQSFILIQRNGIRGKGEVFLSLISSVTQPKGAIGK
jgi:hypothetical protein